METLENIAQNQNKKTELFNKDILDIKTFSEKISKMYESEFEEAFKQIIILSKDDFMSFISNGIQSLLIEMYGEENLNNKNLKNIQQKSFSHIEKEYINHYIKLNHAWENYIKEKNNHNDNFSMLQLITLDFHLLIKYLKNNQYYNKNNNII